ASHLEPFVRRSDLERAAGRLAAHNGRRATRARREQDTQVILGWIALALGALGVGGLLLPDVQMPRPYALLALGLGTFGTLRAAGVSLPVAAEEAAELAAAL